MNGQLLVQRLGGAPVRTLRVSHRANEEPIKGERAYSLYSVEPHAAVRVEPPVARTPNLKLSPLKMSCAARRAALLYRRLSLSRRRRLSPVVW